MTTRWLDLWDVRQVRCLLGNRLCPRIKIPGRFKIALIIKNAWFKTHNANAGTLNSMMINAKRMTQIRRSQNSWRKRMTKTQDKNARRKVIKKNAWQNSWQKRTRLTHGKNARRKTQAEIALEENRATNSSSTQQSLRTPPCRPAPPWRASPT